MKNNEPQLRATGRDPRERSQESGEDLSLTGIPHGEGADRTG